MNLEHQDLRTAKGCASDVHDVLGDVEQLRCAGLQGAAVLADGDAEAVDHVDVHRVDSAAARLQAPQLHVVLADILQQAWALKISTCQKKHRVPPAAHHLRHAIRAA